MQLKLQILLGRAYHYLTTNNRLKGVITESDLLKAYLQFKKKPEN